MIMKVNTIENRMKGSLPAVLANSKELFTRSSGTSPIGVAPLGLALAQLTLPSRNEGLTAISFFPAVSDVTRIR